MGKHNRERRAAKRRARARRPDTSSHVGNRRSAHRDGAGGPHDTTATGGGEPLGVDGFLAVLRAAIRHGGELDLLADRTLDDAATAADPAVRAEVTRTLRSLISGLLWRAFEGGWQPSDLVAVVRRTLKPAHVQLVSAELLRPPQREGRASAIPVAPPPTWQAQLDQIAGDAGLDPPFGEAPLGASLPDSAAGDVERWRLVVAVAHLLDRLPSIPVLVPPPSAWVAGHGGPAGAAGLDPKVLGKVRALLAKAESTTFAAEAEALTAKAQDLMARHALDQAVLDAAADAAAVGPGPHRAGPESRRLWIDNPYTDAKSMLLHHVAAANRCQSVMTTGLGFATVFGFAVDLDAVELLFTSLLVQATSAVLQAGSHVDGRGRSRTRSFRQSFWVSYASRIGQRLERANASATAAATADHGEALLPVLASRQARVDEAVSEAFPRLTHRSISVSNRAGWVAGAVAADQADLGVHDAVPSG